ncbi:membrane protein [Bordetella holmesii F627]|nr:membrane protein [Bordetella holmesii F627]
MTAQWLAESLRLREEHWGPLEDHDEARRARLTEGDFSARVLERARLLASREHLDDVLLRWRQGAVFALLILLVIVLASGAGVAYGALGDGSRPVNVLWALGALLGLHGLMFLLWLASFLLPAGRATGLGRLWLWITRKLARGPDSALIPQALLNLLARSGALRWLLGTVSHLLWLAALCSALGALIVILSTASYRFIWATTLLGPEAFVRLTAWAGWLPAQLGFSLPHPDIVRASDGQQVLPAAAQVQWSVWLIGMVVCWGIVPRLLAALLCLTMSARALAKLRIDPELAGYAALRDRLTPAAQASGMDRPADPLRTPRITHTAAIGGRPVYASLELPAEQNRPVPATETVFDAGNLDTREQRNALLDALAASPASRLLLACDAHQTPDRGSLALIASLSAHAGQTRIWLLGAGERLAQWRTRLQDAGLPAAAILDAQEPALQWLERGSND